MQKDMKMKAKATKQKKKAELMIASEHEALVAEVEQTIAAMARKDAQALFARGGALARVKSVLPEKTFGKWVKQRCGYTPRLARLQVASYENLSPFHERLIDAHVAPTIVYALSSVGHVKVEEVIAAFETGLRLSVASVKQMIKPEGVEDKKPVPLGGAAGLRRAGEARMKADMDAVTKLVKGSLKVVELLVAEMRKGKHLAKTKLAAAVEDDCRQAAILIDGVISPRGSSAPLVIEWEKARQVIARLGDAPRYPGRDEFADWVIEQALPALRFVVHGTPVSGEGNAREEGEVAPATDPNDRGVTVEADDDDMNVEAAEPAPPTRQLGLVPVPSLVPDDDVASVSTANLEIVSE